MKRIMNLARLSLIAAGIMVLATLTACGASSSAGSGAGSGAAKKVSDEPKIGVAKIVAHPALDALEKGIVEEITAAFPRAKIDLQNANGEPATASQIAQKFKVDKVDVAVGIATPTAMALANVLTDIPVIYSAVTDPVAAGLVASYDKGGEHITGTSDLPPLEGQIDALLALAPKAKRIGHIYNAGEANSVSTAAKAEAYVKSKGLEFVTATVTNSAEVSQALTSLVGRVDGIYLSTDNTVFSAISTVADICLKAKLPLVTADPSSAEQVPVLAAVGFNYYEMGKATGRIVVEVLKGKKTADIPTYFAKDPKEQALVINLDVAKQIGVTVPQDMVSRASLVIGK
ncbi:ABC transporter substrate-binding protein [Gracilinema caldarium]|uniref:ABC transporter substrate-binding protein n=1 Tax=Gracilinema caldarium TaxID=215591 RepID=UPI0026F3510A|nr:ABC transporter substrate-binding protein [Gracilinema caldarium]